MEINNTDKELKHGQMEVVTLVNGKMEKSMGMERIYGQEEKNMLESLKTIKWTDKEL